MAYKNSGAMKFNDATDLVIRADPAGIVESVYNLADNTEYIGTYSRIENVTVIVTNNTAVSKTIYNAYVNADGYIQASLGYSLNPNQSVSRTVLNKSLLVLGGTGATFNIISGSGTVNANTFLANGNAVIEIIPS